jgi:hypothetical protein
MVAINPYVYIAKNGLIVIFVTGIFVNLAIMNIVHIHVHIKYIIVEIAVGEVPVIYTIKNKNIFIMKFN